LPLVPRRHDPHPLALAIGSRVRVLRQQRSLTAERLAYESDLNSKGYLSDIEHGLALPSLETLHKLAEVLEVEIVDLLTTPEDHPRHALIERTRGLDAPMLRRLLTVADAGSPDVTASTRGPAERNSTLLPAFARLEVAAGKRARPRLPSSDEDHVRLPGTWDAVECFAVRAAGESMVGWRREIRSGDWLVFRWSRVGLGAATGRVALVAYRDRDGDVAFQVKRIARRDRRLRLVSDNPRYPAELVTARHELFGLLVASYAPDQLAPTPDTRIPAGLVGARFGLGEDPGPGWNRVEGHLFAVLDREQARLLGGGSTKRRRRRPLRCPVALQPAETAFVLAEEDTDYRYLGVAQSDSANTLAILL
jgi:transcriptional regulator with XRE-family HTH domain